MTIITKSTNSSAGQGVEERELPYSVNRRQLGAVTRENNMELPQKTKTRTIIWSSKPIPGYISGKKKPESTNLKIYLH